MHTEHSLYRGLQRKDRVAEGTLNLITDEEADSLEASCTTQAKAERQDVED